MGSVAEILAEALDARVMTTSLGMGKMILLRLTAERVYLLNPGQRLDVVARQLQPSSLPPSVDTTETLLEHLTAVREALPFFAPDQTAVELMMAGMERS